MHEEPSGLLLGKQMPAEKKENYLTNPVHHKPRMKNKTLEICKVPSRKRSEERPSLKKNECKQVQDALRALGNTLGEIHGGNRIFAKTEHYILRKLK